MTDIVERLRKRLDDRLRKRLDPNDPDLWVLDGDRTDAADEIERLRTPICVGKTIIQILARDGTWQSENSNGLIAADELFHNDPYAEIERLRRALQKVADLVDSEADDPLDDAISIALKTLASPRTGDKP